MSAFATGRIRPSTLYLLARIALITFAACKTGFSPSLYFDRPGCLNSITTIELSGLSSGVSSLKMIFSSNITMSPRWMSLDSNTRSDLFRLSDEMNEWKVRRSSIIQDRKSVGQGKSVSVRVDHGGSSNFTKKKKEIKNK